MNGSSDAVHIGRISSGFLPSVLQSLTSNCAWRNERLDIFYHVAYYTLPSLLFPVFQKISGTRLDFESLQVPLYVYCRAWLDCMQYAVVSDVTQPVRTRRLRVCFNTHAQTWKTLWVKGRDYCASRQIFESCKCKGSAWSVVFLSRLPDLPCLLCDESAPWRLQTAS